MKIRYMPLLSNAYLVISLLFTVIVSFSINIRFFVENIIKVKEKKNIIIIINIKTKNYNNKHLLTHLSRSISSQIYV